MYEWLYIVELSWFCDDLEKKQVIVHIGWEFHFLALYHEYNLVYSVSLDSVQSVTSCGIKIKCD